MRQVALFKLLQYRQSSFFIKLTQGIDRPLIKVSIGHQTCIIYTQTLSYACVYSTIIPPLCTFNQHSHPNKQNVPVSGSYEDMLPQKAILHVFIY